jgi:hypothetical protein
VSDDRTTVAFRILIVFGLAAAVWKIPGGGTAAAVSWELLGAGMLAAIGWSAWRFAKAHSFDLDRLEQQGRVVLYGSVGMLMLVVASRSVLWASVLGSVLWAVMLGAAISGGVISWRAWREL